MKKYSELTPAQQEVAREAVLQSALESVCEGFIEWLDEDTQVKVRAAGEKAAQMQTPWFASEYIMETCRGEFEEIARREAEAALYVEPSDPPLVRGIFAAADALEERRLAGDRAEPSAEEKARRNDEQALALQIAAQGRSELR